MALFLIGNYPQPTTAAPAGVTTGTSLKTMLQVRASATLPFRITEWGYSLSATPSAAGKVELIEVNVAATVTAHVAAGIIKLDGDAIAGGDPTTNLIQVGTTATGYTATAEGSITVARSLDTGMYSVPAFIKQFPLGQEPLVQANQYLRIRAHFSAAVDMLCYVKISL